MRDRNRDDRSPDPFDRTVAAPDGNDAAAAPFEQTIAAEALDRTLAAQPDAFDQTVAAGGGGGAPEAPAGAFDVPRARYAERGELGRGGMGRVADAFDRMLGRRVAVKHILSSDPAAVQRFAREVRITAQLEHPGIVPLYEAGRSPDQSPYYVMRRVDGRPLDHALPKGSSPAELAQRLALVPNFLVACDAMAYAHARGIVHRDLKPSNILLGPFGETLVIDWGLARAANERDEDDAERVLHDPTLTITGSVSGTPGYMAPEQARGEPIDARGDVFALGATLFYLLAGRPPYAGSTVASVIERVAMVQAPDWDRLPDGVPDDLRAILVKALAGDPAARYADAGALAADLRHFVTGNLVGAHRYSRLERLRRFVRRHRAAVAIAAISLAMIGAISAIAIRRVVDERDEATRARTLETERANELAIAQARLLLDTNPTLATALVKPLALGAHWREVRDVVAAARARGVPWRLPSSPVTRHAGVSQDGRRGYSVGGDGVIRIYDLPARTARVALELGRPVDSLRPARVELLDGSRFALFDGKALAIVDERTGARTAIPLAARAMSSGLRGGVLYWIDQADRAWRLDGARPVQLPVEDRVIEVQPAPDGSSIAVRGRRATWLVRGDTSTRILDERASAIAWHPAGIGLIVVTEQDRKLLRVRVANLEAPEDTNTKVRADSAAIANGLAITQGLQGISINGARKVEYQEGERGVQLVVARDEIVVGATRNGHLDVFDDDRHVRLRAPVAELDLIASSPASPYVITGGGALLLLWDLDPIIARRGPVSDRRLVTAGPHHDLLWRLEGATTWLDLHTLAMLPGPAVPVLAKLAHGDARVAVLDTNSGAVHALRRGTMERVEVARGAKRVALLDDRRLVLATADHRVALHDLDAKTTAPLFTATSEPRWLHASGDHVVAVGYDGAAIRHQISTGRTARITVPVRGDIEHVLALDAAGRFWFADGAVLKYWDGGGAPVAHTTLPGPIALLVPIDDGHYALGTEAAGYVVDAAVPGSARRTVPLPVRRKTGDWEIGTSVSASTDGFFAVPGPLGGAQLVDASTGEAWRVGQPGTQQATARLSRDGTVLYEWRGRRLVYWRLALPRMWLTTMVDAHALTNAELAPDGGLRWP